METQLKTSENKRKGGSNNPIIFHDYDGFVAKFTDKPKTTDDCYTPKDVYEAVLEYVSTVVDLKDKLVLRPFYPGGDYENAEYPDNGIVVDNPPFSIFSKIVKFYSENNIPFFLFAPGMTVMSVVKYCTAVITNTQITFHNKATVRINFASNLYGNDIAATTAPTLMKLIKEKTSQNIKANLSKFAYPPQLVSVSDLQTICNGGIEFQIKRSECVAVRKVGGRNLFGDNLLVGDALGRQKKAAKEAAKKAAKEAAKSIIPVMLTEREMQIVKQL